TAEPPPKPIVVQQRPQPTAAPIETPPAQPQLVELRFDSLPSAGVYADGRSAELCRTPCRFNVELTDGGPTDHRTFVVRTDGYQDHRVEVDFTKAERDFSVSLERIEPPPAPPGAVDMTSEESEPTAEKASAHKSGAKKTGKKVDDKKVEAK